MLGVFGVCVCLFIAAHLYVAFRGIAMWVEVVVVVSALFLPVLSNKRLAGCPKGHVKKGRWRVCNNVLVVKFHQIHLQMVN